MNPFSAIWLSLKGIISLLKGDLSNSNYSKILQDLLYVFLVIAITICLLIAGYIINNNSDEPVSNTIFYVSAGIFVLLWLILIVFAIIKFGKFKYHSLCGKCSDFKVISHINAHIKAGCIESEKLLNGLFRNAENHNEFINEVQKYASLADEELNLIRNDIKKSVCGRFLCVVTNQDYLDVTEEEMKDMFGYFLSTYSASQKNYIARVFCIPAENNGSLKYGKLKSAYKKEKQSNNIVLFKYLLINQIAGVSTYLQIHKKGNHLFFPNIDYVLAAPLSLKVTNDKGEEGFNCSNRLYFSYTRDVDNVEDIDRIIYTSDSCLVKIFENEFYFRLPNDERVDSSSQSYQFPLSKSDDSYHMLRDALHLSDKDINSSIKELIEYIDKSTEIVQKNQFIHKLNDYKV